MTSASEREEKLQHLIEYGADKLWQPMVNALLDVYQKFDKGLSKCNTVLLITEHDYFNDFYVCFLEPALPKGAILHHEWMSGYWLKKYVETVKEKIIFLEWGIWWFASKYAKKESRARSVRDLLEASIRGRKFLIICGYESDMGRFRELLSLAFPDEKPEIKEFALKPLS